MEFQKWPSIPRLSKEIATVTEKIDGSNSCIRIRPSHGLYNNQTDIVVSSDSYNIWAQSRTRFLRPTKHEDNFGFAAWVSSNATALVEILGLGDHYGEWWGNKIQRGYGLTNGTRRFSLFNVRRWEEIIDVHPGSTDVEELCTVPLLYQGSFLDMDLKNLRESLVTNGSVAAPGFKAEGMVVSLRELNASYKVLLENDYLHKWELK